MLEKGVDIVEPRRIDHKQDICPRKEGDLKKCLLKAGALQLSGDPEKSRDPGYLYSLSSLNGSVAAYFIRNCSFYWAIISHSRSAEF